MVAQAASDVPQLVVAVEPARHQLALAKHRMAG
jgi:hypothetical protein